MSKDLDYLQSLCKVSIEDELQRNPDLNLDQIQQIQNWLKKQPHLPPLLDNQIVIFLVICRHSVEQTKKLIDVHFTMRTHYKDIFANRDPESKAIKTMMDVMYVGLFRGTDLKGRRVTFSSLKSKDPTHYHGPTGVKMIYMFEDILKYKYGSRKEGVVAVMDASGFGPAHLSTISLSFIKQGNNYFLQGTNMLVCEIIVLNANPIAEKLLMILKPFIPSDVYKRIFVYSKEKMSKIFNHIAKENVPVEYGGTGGTLEELGEEGKQLLIEHREFYLAEERLQKVNEALRPADSKNDIKEMAGSFKKLDLD